VGFYAVGRFYEGTPKELEWLCSWNEQEDVEEWIKEDALSVQGAGPLSPAGVWKIVDEDGKVYWEWDPEDKVYRRNYQRKQSLLDEAPF
jgi:hypothetical protein